MEEQNGESVFKNKRDFLFSSTEQQADTMATNAPPPSEFLQRLRHVYSPHPQLRSIQEILQSMDSDDWQIRLAAVQSLGMQAPQVALEPLIRALQDEHASVRVAALRVAGKFSGDAPLSHIIQASHDPDWRVRAATVQALARLGKRTPLDPLVAALQDEDDAVRAAAASALGVLNNSAAIAPLTQALKDPSWQVREKAVIALGELEAVLGVQAPLVDLAQAAQDNDAQVRGAVQSLAQDHPDLFAAIDVARAALALLENDVGRIVVPQLPLFGPRRASGPTDAQQPTSRVVRKRLVRALGQPYKKQEHVVTRRFALGAVAAAVIVGNGLLWSNLLRKPVPVLSPHARPSRLGEPVRAYHGQAQGALTVAWSPDSTHIVSGGADTTVQIHEARTGQCIRTYPGHSQVVFAVAWSDDGKYIASGSNDTTVHIWNAMTGALVRVYQGHKASVLDLDWSPDSTHIVSSSGDGIVLVWEVATGRTIGSYAGQAGDVASIAWSPDGRYIAAVGQQDRLWIREAVSGQLLYTQPALLNSNTYYNVLCNSINWSPDSTRLAFSDRAGTIHIIDGVMSRTGPGSLSIVSSSVHPKAAYVAAGSLAWSPDGKSIATTTGNKTVQVWDATTGQAIFTCQDPSFYIFCVAWSPDGRYIASACWDDPALVLWQAAGK